MSDLQTALAKATQGQQLPAHQTTFDPEKSDKWGWVSVLPLTERDIRPDGEVSPRFRGLLIEGEDADGRLRNRTLVMDRRSPTWFRNLVINQAKVATDKFGQDRKKPFLDVPSFEFRVVVTNVLQTGHLAFIMPADTVFNATAAQDEFDRRLLVKDGWPQCVAECRNFEAFAEFVYTQTGRLHGHAFHHLDEKGRGVMVSYNDSIVQGRGAEKLWELRTNLTGFTKKAALEEMAHQVRFDRIYRL